MSDIFDNWLDGLSILITDDMISFYTFFTVIFAEISYLWAFMQVKNIIPITIILFGYVLNVVIAAALRGYCFLSATLEKICQIVYVLVFIILFVVGCFFNWIAMLITTVILFSITALWIGIREHQDSVYVGYEASLVNFINTLFRNKVFWLLSQIIVIGGPFIAFTIFCANIPNLPIFLKILFPLIHLILSPLIAYFEDDSATCTIFELAFE